MSKSEMEIQKAVCLQFGSKFEPSFEDEKLGLALLVPVTENHYYLNGVRHQKDQGTCGWFIWNGNIFEERAEFFQPIHVTHLWKRLPMVLPYLGLAPGWRFLIANDHVDVWYDENIV
ncbi:MAG: hypothetical protein AAFR71_08580 [Pseudomonadota bacterium]